MAAVPGQAPDRVTGNGATRGEPGSPAAQFQSRGQARASLRCLCRLAWGEMTVLVLLRCVEIITVHVDTTHVGLASPKQGIKSWVGSCSQRALPGQHCPTVTRCHLRTTPMPGSVWLWGADGALAP